MRRALTLVLLSLLGVLAQAGPVQARERLQTWTLTSRFVNPAINPFNGRHVLRVDVLLPNGYDGSRRFPLLLLLHGHGDSYSSWIDPTKGDLLRIAPQMPAIVVMPEGGQGWYTDWWDGGVRGADGRGWESFYLDELLPLIQRRLQILPGRRYHTVAGLSMGGEGAAYLAAQRPDYFGTMATFSGVLSLLRPEWPTGFGTQGQSFQKVYGQPGGFYVQGHDPTTLTTNLPHTRVFARVGDGLAIPTYPHEATNYFGAAAEAELRQHADDFVAAARAAGAAVHYEPVHGIHDWPWWRLALVSALHWGLFASVPDLPPDWTFRTVRQRGRAWNLRYSFARPPSTLESFRRDGATLAATGSGIVTIRPIGGRPFTAMLPFTRTLLPPPAIRSLRGTREGQALRYRVSQAATVRITLSRHSCTGSPPRAEHCRMRRIGTLTRHAHAGINMLRLLKRLAGRRLSAGRYIATARATNANGTSTPVSATIRIGG